MFSSNIELTISTEKLQESKDFYMQHLGFNLRYEDEWYIELGIQGNEKIGICFKLPQREEGDFFNGKGIVLSLCVDNVDQEFEKLRSKGVHIYQGLHNKEWGERSFVVKDPNELLIYIYSKFL